MKIRQLLEIKVLTPDGILFEASELQAVNIRLSNGLLLGIRPGHAPLIAETMQGPVSIRNNSDADEITLYAGVLEIRNNTIIILTAGKVEKTPQEITATSELEFDRLMKTLLNQIIPETTIGRE